MSKLRPLPRPELQTAELKSAGRPPKLDFLALSKLRIDDSYQRTIERKGLCTIQRIVDDFNWNRFAPLVVARVPGKEELYAIIDGQHRATAALIRGFDLVPCMIVEAGVLEQPAIFTAVNGNVTPVTIFQLFKAARAAKAEWAVAIDQACETGGIKPLCYPKAKKEIRPFETMAIGTLRKLIIRHGVDDVAAAIRHAKSQLGADEPGFWTSSAIEYALGDWRTRQGKRPETPADASPISMAQRIRDLRNRGYSRFAIQAALRCKLADIEEAIGEAR